LVGGFGLSPEQLDMSEAGWGEAGLCGRRTYRHCPRSGQIASMLNPGRVENLGLEDRIFCADDGVGLKLLV